MLAFIDNLRHSLVSKLIISVGATLLVTISTWAYFNIQYQKKRLKRDMAEGAEKLSDTIILGTHYAMMLNSREDINQIIKNISLQRDIQTVRIYNKKGQIKYSNLSDEVDTQTNIKAEACDICHRTDPPLTQLDLENRTRLLRSASGSNLLGIISPIYNKYGCSANSCHYHPPEKKILGALDVVLSLENTEKELLFLGKGIIGLAIFVILLTSLFIFVLVFRFVKKPISRLITGTRLISKGDYSNKINIESNNEMRQLAKSINQMSEDIGKKQAELNRQKEEYQKLFENVPCIVTVQDRDYKLIGYNREFAEKFAPEPGDYCFYAYKGRKQKCEICPVERTFEDGQSHYSEESGMSKNGRPSYWIVKTSPIRNADGEIAAVMEMNLDITHRKQLEQELEKSEKKYHEIFNNIPNPVFVLDTDTLKILDCNDSVTAVYGYSKQEIKQKSFLDLFPEEDKPRMTSELKTSAEISQVKQLHKEEKTLYVNIRVSPTEYPGRKVLLVTTSDITQRLEAEQQLIQASKMATLGEMATGVAHELNQPLAVIKTASSFFMKKINKKQRIDDTILFTMAEEIDSHVDRASKIINHMREFGRKSDLNLADTQVNTVLLKTHEIFSQQLKVRGIEVVWNLAENLPTIMADPDRLEQVFINLLINARDGIMDKLASVADGDGDKKIFLSTRSEKEKVIVEVCDTGTGVSPAIADKIFDPFFTTKDVGKGTGLGLSISYGIIKDFGGTIQVLPRKEGGACFVVTFPVPQVR
ncbi:MAG: PAS domain S-box protein [Desulfobacterales bacterium]|jgi:histidine kinase